MAAQHPPALWPCPPGARPAHLPQGCHLLCRQHQPALGGADGLLAVWQRAGHREGSVGHLAGDVLPQAGQAEGMSTGGCRSGGREGRQSLVRATSDRLHAPAGTLRMHARTHVMLANASAHTHQSCASSPGRPRSRLSMAAAPAAPLAPPPAAALPWQEKPSLALPADAASVAASAAAAAPPVGPAGSVAEVLAQLAAPAARPPAAPTAAPAAAMRPDRAVAVCSPVSPQLQPYCGQQTRWAGCW